MTRNKRDGGFAARMSSKFDIQPEMLFHGCRLELRGRSSLAVGGCFGIVSYSPSCIVLRLRESFLRVCGLRLFCDSYTGGEVLISGRIDLMSFEERAE